MADFLSQTTMSALVLLDVCQPCTYYAVFFSIPIANSPILWCQWRDRVQGSNNSIQFWRDVPFFFFLAKLNSFQDLSSQQRIDPTPSAVKVWGPNYCSTRESRDGPHFRCQSHMGTPGGPRIGPSAYINSGVSHNPLPTPQRLGLIKFRIQEMLYLLSQFLIMGTNEQHRPGLE